MNSSTKSQQKSYRKGSSLYFSAGLLLSMVLVVTAFEWKTPFSLLEDPIEYVEQKEIDKPIFDPVVIPEKPRPKIKSIEIAPSPDPEIENPVEKEPPIEIEETTTPYDPITDGLPAMGAPTEEEPVVADMVSKAAAPANGFTAFHQYIFNGLRVPDHLIARNKDGKVTVSFVVNTDGTLSDIQIVKGLDKQLEQQIIKLLQNAPAWEPAIQNGRRVRTRMQLPITITISH